MGGVNDQGLFFNIASCPPSQGPENPRKPVFPLNVHYNLNLEFLQKCANVEEALELAQSYSYPYKIGIQIMFADKSGASAIIGWVNGEFKITRKKDAIQVMTNFSVSNPELGNYPCLRYEIASRLLRESDLLIKSFRNILSAVHAEGESWTVYSNIYDLNKGLIYIYYQHDFENAMILDIEDELKKGEHVIDLRTSFPATYARTLNAREYTRSIFKLPSTLFFILGLLFYTAFILLIIKYITEIRKGGNSELNLKTRLASLLFYLGFSQFFPFLLFKKKNNDLLRSEYRIALSVYFYVNLSLIIILINYLIALPYIAAYFPRSLDTLFIGNIFLFDYIFFFALLAGIIIWLIYLVRIMTGLNFWFPLVKKISRKSKILTFSYFLNVLKLIFVIFFIFCAYQSVKYSKLVNENPKVYILYDDMGHIPEWIFSFASYRIFTGANDKWGRGEVTILPENEETITKALNNATMLLVLGHGAGLNGLGSLTMYNKTRDEFYAFYPYHVIANGKGKNLKYVFLAGCNAGFLDYKWKEVLHPAEIKTFNRLAFGISDHLYWLWFKLPGILKEI